MGVEWRWMDGLRAEEEQPARVREFEERPRRREEVRVESDEKHRACFIDCGHGISNREKPREFPKPPGCICKMPDGNKGESAQNASTPWRKGLRCSDEASTADMVERWRNIRQPGRFSYCPDHARDRPQSEPMKVLQLAVN
jgi:hypothetical protein